MKTDLNRLDCLLQRAKDGTHRGGLGNITPAALQICSFSLLELFVQTRLFYLCKLSRPGYQHMGHSGSLAMAMMVGEELEFHYSILVRA